MDKRRGNGSSGGLNFHQVFDWGNLGNEKKMKRSLGKLMAVANRPQNNGISPYRGSLFQKKVFFAAKDLEARRKENSIRKTSLETYIGGTKPGQKGRTGRTIGLPLLPDNGMEETAPDTESSYRMGGA